jgi:hypothetical protein
VGKSNSGAPGLHFLAQRDIDRHHLAVERQENNLFTVAPPSRRPSAVAGNLELAAAGRKRPHVHLEAPERIRVVRDPAIVG